MKTEKEADHVDVNRNVVAPAAVPLPELPHEHEDNNSSEDEDMASVEPPSKQPKSDP